VQLFLLANKPDDDDDGFLGFFSCAANWHEEEQ